MEFATIEQLNNYLEEKQKKSGINLGLDRMELACKELGNPEKDLKVIHYAGSNGKGSTLQFTKEILIAQGFSVGSFTSPAQKQMLDQIMYNHEMISEDEFLEISNELVEKVSKPEELTEFEWITLVALRYFEKKKPDFVLIETGMGGRLDSTNVVNPIISVITTISMEHAQFLGDTVEKIAAEKAGIIKPGKPVVVGKLDPSVLEVIQERAMQCKSELYAFYKGFAIDVEYFHEDGELFNFYRELDLVHEDLHIELNGMHQVENASVALMVCEVLKEQYNTRVFHEAVRKGLENCKWPGRFELVSRKPYVILDGGHNPAGISVLLDTLKRKYMEKNIKFVFSCFKDKDAAAMIAQLDAAVNEIFFTEMKHERSAKAEDLYALSKSSRKKLVKDLTQLKFSEKKADVTVVVGSLQLVKEVREAFFRNK
ncbi:MAG: hypothetical protein K0R71_1177 [Bacillales bacterium]|jgi:dihydrofolate synthase/folylpolyglutamate synthase|nr:hypothetical protein [Bacillales bacterium]